MKKLLLIFTAFAMIACKSNSGKSGEDSKISEEKNTETINIDPDGVNQLVPDEEDGGEILLGKITYDRLAKEPFKEWFTASYDAHTVDQDLMDSLKMRIQGHSIKVVMGSWCEDSQREVPALIKIMKAIDYDPSAIDFLAVDHNKTTPTKMEAPYDIEYVPTIMIFKEGQELNRVVEYPIGTLEQDLLMILKGEEYAHAYSD